MDLIIILVLLGVTVFIFKRMSNFIYGFVIIDIFLRIVTFLKVQLTKGELYSVIDKYIPADIPAILDKYADGLLLTVLIWLYVIVYIIFLSYIFRSFLRKS